MANYRVDGDVLFLNTSVPVNIRDVCESNNIRKIVLKGDINSFEHLSTSVEKIYCSDTQITSFEHLPISVKKIKCSYTRIASFEHLPNSVEEIDCIGTRITSFKHIPNSVEKINCSFTNITSFEHLPTSVKKIICIDTRITSFKHLPTSVKKIYCSFTQIASFEYLPSSVLIEESDFGNIGTKEELHLFRIREGIHKINKVLWESQISYIQNIFLFDYYHVPFEKEITIKGKTKMMHFTNKQIYNIIKKQADNDELEE